MSDATEKYADIEVLGDPSGAVLMVTLDRPDRRNAMSQAMVNALLALLRSPHASQAGAILLSGAGQGFCAGSDLFHLAAMTPHDRGLFEADCGRLAQAMVAFPRPILCAVHGFAIGGGLTLAAAADIVVTAPDARWSLPEVPMGLFPAWGLGPVSRRVGTARARRLSWGIDTFDGGGAERWGLADIVADAPFDRAMEVAIQLAGLPRAQVAAVKDYFAIDRDGEAADRHADSLFLAAGMTVEAQVNFARFAEG